MICQYMLSLLAFIYKLTIGLCHCVSPVHSNYQYKQVTTEYLFTSNNNNISNTHSTHVHVWGLRAYWKECNTHRQYCI